MESRKQNKPFYKNTKILFLLGGLITVVVLLFFLSGDDGSHFFKITTTQDSTSVKKDNASPDEYNKIVDGIHLRTGLVEADGLMTVVNNCTNCHSSKLIVQNRMDEERWKATIKWMQETQNLWDLGENEQIIIDYLVTNYPPEEKGRRPNLENIEWYQLN
ncbi:hypothetical protein [Flavimarina sp. Hel_I_48]|uniref:hypothetical protein n=1 Tax=Flavimarina sp. Hel_I_48 TaxID=1392488 RepID=UPI00056A529B|nr:hypothetical protein [Flavimarina sp. Hel_I_48]